MQKKNDNYLQHMAQILKIIPNQKSSLKQMSQVKKWCSNNDSTNSKDQWKFKKLFSQLSQLTKNGNLKLESFSQLNVSTTILPQGLACAQK